MNTLFEQAASLDDRLYYLELRLGHIQLNEGNADARALFGDAMSGRRTDIAVGASSCLRAPLSDLDANFVTKIAFDLESRDDLRLDELAAALILSGVVKTQEMTQTLASLLPQCKRDDGGSYQLNTPWRPGGYGLGTAAAAAYFAGSERTARVLATVRSEMHTGGNPHTPDDGDYPLARFVLYQTELDEVVRANIIRSAVQIDCRSNIYPLFSRLYLDAAQAEFEMGEVQEAARHAERSIYLWRIRDTRSNVRWCPRATESIAAQVPFDPAEIQQFFERHGLADAGQQPKRLPGA